MTQVADQEIRPGIIYQFSPEHRNKKNSEKSLWTIDPDEERQVFESTTTPSGLLSTSAGDYIFRNGFCNIIPGIDKTRAQQLIVARFVDDNHVQVWHGYPADPNRRSQQARIKEIPPEEIQKVWLRDNVVPKPTLRKIGKGEPVLALKVTLPGRFWDSYIYANRLYLVNDDESITTFETG